MSTEEHRKVPARTAAAGGDAFEVSVTRLGDGRVVVEVVGELDMVTAPRLTNAVAAEPGPDTTSLVVDLSGITFLATAGITELVSLRTRTSEANVQLLLVPGPRIVRRPLELMGLLDLFTVHPSQTAALNAATITPPR